MGGREAGGVEGVSEVREEVESEGEREGEGSTGELLEAFGAGELELEEEQGDLAAGVLHSGLNY